jgi:hypothetical protein
MLPSEEEEEEAEAEAERKATRLSGARRGLYRPHPERLVTGHKPGVRERVVPLLGVRTPVQCLPRQQAVLKPLAERSRRR